MKLCLTHNRYWRNLDPWKGSETNASDWVFKTFTNDANRRVCVTRIYISRVYKSFYNTIRMDHGNFMLYKIRSRGLHVSKCLNLVRSSLLKFFSDLWQCGSRAHTLGYKKLYCILLVAKLYCCVLWIAKYQNLRTTDIFRKNVICNLEGRGFESCILYNRWKRRNNHDRVASCIQHSIFSL